jgi:glycosyltransferase involved in cell wall biosynthesis
MLNIAMIAYTNYTTDSRVIREAEAAVGSGYNVDFISLKRPNDTNKENINGVNVIRLKQFRYRGSSSIKYIISYLEFFVRCFFKITILFFKKKYLIIHVNNMPNFMVFSTIIPKLLGSKIILDIHDSMPEIFCSKFTNRLLYDILIFEEKISHRFSDITVTVHEPIKQDLLKKHGLDFNKIEIIRNIGDDNIFTLLKKDCTYNSINAVFHGTIAERFGFENLLKGFKAVKKKFNNLTLTIIGEGDYGETLKNLIAEYSLQDTVIFDNNFYPVVELPSILSFYNMGIVSYEKSPATDYNLPVKLFEYILLGLPVLTVNNSAIKYYFSDKDLIYYDSADLDSLINVLSDLCGKPEKLKDYRDRILKIRDKFLWSSEKIKYIEIIKNLI